MGVACLRKEALMEKALTIVQIPEEYQLYIEDYGEEGGAMFAWGIEEQDDGIVINMDIAGNLTYLSIDKSEEVFKPSLLLIEEKRKRAEDFLLLHYPNAFQYLTFSKTNEMSQVTRFNYEQIVMDLPLGEPSCIIDIDPMGNIVRFDYNGAKVIPEIPETLISKEKIIQEVQKNLNLQLSIIYLYPEIYDVEEEGLRLVYEPEQPIMKYKADVLEPTLTTEQEVVEEETLISVPASSITHKEFTNEEIIGVTEQMEIIQEVDSGTETCIVWRDRNWKSDETDLSIEGISPRPNEGTVKAFISKKSGKIKRFIWFKERKGDLELTREACYLIGIEFLQTVIPEYYQYLQLIVREDDENKDNDFQKELFLFKTNNGYGVLVKLGMVMVSVNRNTGYVDYFTGAAVDLEQLVNVPTEPTISRTEAEKLFNDHLDFELAWNNDYDSKTYSFILAYEACNRKTKTAIRYVDAMTGEIISSIDD